MGDLIMGLGLIGVGLSGMFGLGYMYYIVPRKKAKIRRLNRMSAVQLHAELTRCVGAIMECARIGDKQGMQHAHKAMKPIMCALYAK